MKKRTLIPTLILGSLLTGSLALAGPGGCGNCDRSGGCGGFATGQQQGRHAVIDEELHQERMQQRMEMMRIVLDLSPQQQQQIEALQTRHWQDSQELRQQMQASREELRTLQTAKNFDEAEFFAKATKQAELKSKMLAQKNSMKKEVYALLTPEQQEKADQLGGMTGGKGRGRHHGKGMRF